MRGLVVGNNLNAATAIGRDLAADGIHVTCQRLSDPSAPQGRSPLGEVSPRAEDLACCSGGQLVTDYDVVVFLCDGSARPLRTTPLAPPSPAGGEGNEASRRVVAPPPPKEGETSLKAGTFPLPSAGEDKGEGESGIGRARAPVGLAKDAPSAPSKSPCLGHCLLQQLRAQGNCVPILVIALHGHNRAVCLDAGADAYLAAPYEKPDVAASVRAMVRRCKRCREGSRACAATCERRT